MEWGKKTVSVFLTICLVLPLLSGIMVRPVSAGEDIGSENALDALGIDTSQLPEGYDPNTLDNPYGRDTVTVNPVYELFVTGVFDQEVSTSTEDITDPTYSIPGVRTTTTTDLFRQDILYGHNRSLKQSMPNFYQSQGNVHSELWRRTQKIVEEYPSNSSFDREYQNVYDHSFVAATASASGNFIGENSAGKSGQVVTVGAGSLDEHGGLYLYFTDPISGTRSDLKTLVAEGTDAVLGNSGKKMDEDFADAPYLMQNYLQISAGDFDNDGIDEVAVYVPEQGKSRVEIYKLHTTSSTDDDFYLTAENWKKEWTYYFNEAPFVSNMVSLTAGDFSRDGTDDLALTWGYYYGPGENSGCQAVVLYGANANMLQKKRTIDLNYEGADIVRAAFAYGDVDGDNVNDLILGGQLASDIAGGNLNTRFIGIYTYDGFTDSFIQTTARNFDLFEKEDGQYVHAVMADRGDKYYSSPSCLANIAAVNTNGVGHAAYIYLDSILYEYGNQGLSISAPLDRDPQFNKNINQPGTNPTYVEYGAVSADFNGDSKEALQLMQYYLPALITTVVPSYLWWWHFWFPIEIDVEYSGDLDMLGVYEESDLQVQRTDAVDFSTSFCRLNTDEDTSLLSYTGEHHITYTDPKVLAVLASPPYFADLDNEELSGSYMESETSYTSTSGGGSGSATSHTINVGVYISFEHEFTAPITGTKLGSIETEASYSHGWTWETATSSTLEQSISYATAAGSDSVAFYSIPMETYVYKSLVPIIDEATGAISGYDEQSMSVNIPHTAAVKVLPLETYERIAADYAELPQISGSVLTHTVGDPATYPSSTAGFGKPIEYTGDWSGVNFGLGSITQEISMTEETETSFTHTNTVEAQIGGGPGNWVFGISAGYENGSNQVTITTQGSSFSGTICNMPMEAEPYNYNYSWKIFAYQYSDGTSSFPVVSYLVQDVSAPPKLPKDFHQNVTETTDSEITLEWSYSGAAAGFQLYRYYEFPEGSGSYELAFVPASDAVGADPATGVRYYKYVDTGLDAYAEYDYQVQVIGATLPPESILSPVNTYRTKTDVGYPSISLQGVADGELLVYPDSTSTVEVIIKNMGDYTQTPRYQWQKLTEDGWTDITGAIGSTYTFRLAGLADEGQYRCRVNAIYEDYYISDYSEVFNLVYAKRTPMIVDGSFTVTDTVVDGKTVPQMGIALKSAHVNHNYVPSGNIVFEVTGADYKQSFPVALEPSDISGEAHASVTLDSPLPAGGYEITAFYTGSRVYKSLTSVDAIPYLSGNSSGYVLTLNSSYTYGDEMLPSLHELDKEGGVTTATPISEGVSFKVVQYSWKIVWNGWWISVEQVEKLVSDFVSGADVTAAQAGTFTLVASVGDTEVAAKQFTVDKRNITIGIQDQNGMAGDSSLVHPDSGILIVSSGALAYSEGIADLGLAVKAVNSAGTEVSIDPDTDPGMYTIVGTAGVTDGTKYANYNFTFVPGTYILTGPKYSVTGVAEELNGKTVGTIEMVSPEGNDNVGWTTKYANGTGLVFLAAPNTGYAVKGWEVVANSTVINTAGSTMILNHQMLSEDITVSVEFEVAQSTLEFISVGREDGTVECTSNTVIQSGDVARNGAEYTFKATPALGYHFVEWQLEEIGKSPANPAGTPAPDGSNTCTITMGTGDTSLYAIFARDSYELTLQGDLQASYWQESALVDGDPVLVTVGSGGSIPGDKEVIVTPKPGFSVISEATWMQDGEPVSGGVSPDNQSYVFTILASTTVAVETEVEHYDVSVTVTGPGSDVNTVAVAVNGVEASGEELSSITGGSALTFTAQPAYGYVFDHWVINGESSSASPLNVAALSGNLNVEAVFTDNNAYTVSVQHNLRGSISYTLNGGDPVSVASGDSIPVFEGDTVSIIAAPEVNFMVENWKVNGVVELTYARSKTFPNISSNIAVEVVFGAQSYSTVTYSAGSGGTIAAASDGVPFESGSNSVGNGSILEFTASSEAGKMVESWTLNGNLVSNAFGEPLVDTTFIIPALSGDADVQVTFTDVLTHSVDLVDMNSSTSIQAVPEFGSDGRIRHGAAAVFTVAPEAGHAIDAVVVAGASQLDFDTIVQGEAGVWVCTLNTVNEDITVSVETLPLYTITVSATGGTVTGGGIYKEGEVVTLTATANSSYRFVNWTEADVEVFSEREYTFPAVADRDLTANFAYVPPAPPLPSPGVPDNLQGFLQENYPGIDMLDQGSGAINHGQVSNPVLFNATGGRTLVFALNWAGSELKISIYSPDGRLYAELSDPTPPLVLEVYGPEAGEWSYTVTGIDVPYPDYPYTAGVGEVDAEFDPPAICGANRYQTAVEVSKTGWPQGAETVVLARADDFPDSLAGISLAYQLDAPVLLTASGSLNADTKNEIRRLGANQVIILGGTGAISAGVENELKGMVGTVTRLGGRNRYETAKIIAEELAKGGSFDTAFIATGRDFPDALAAASYAARQGLPILLVNSEDIPTDTSAALSGLGISNTTVIGGTGVISAGVLSQLPNPTRIFGSNRFETALTLAEEYMAEEARQVYIATGLSFPDALAGSVLAAKRNTGILLLPGNQVKLPDYIAGFVADKGIKAATVFGGSGAVSAGIRNDLKALLK